ncbi:uncharacterized protein A4U43_C06F2710 [Asparagus officinalis]|uniref:Uncharacterized protein n=1 Tax=Asparagus officinalis TaxID=4686 RepID=A0A5P1EJ76_ASPOF|nr:uncharacterized protein A4U43_C06F2710 [Asparagus officinalis]
MSLVVAASMSTVEALKDQAAASMGPLSKASWAVAASVAAVEALKDQAGSELRAESPSAGAEGQGAVVVLAPELGSSGEQGSRPGAAPGSGLDEMAARRRRRKAEKDEAVHHLVCWGPN